MTLTEEQIAERIAAMDVMSNEEIFRKAAEIISNDPFLARGSYLSYLTSADFAATGDRPSWLEDEAEVEIPAEGSFGCHCLEGSIHEAVGIYAPDPVRPGWLTDVGEISYHYEYHRSRALNTILVQVLPLDQLAGMTGLRTIADVLHSPAGTVYGFSDYVLAPKGKEGVRLAVQYLNLAAELATLPKKTS